MKNSFREQFTLEQGKIQDIWKNALVVFDTNILLNLYRYNKETCDDLLKYMKTFADRLWMPFQVGWEYHNNRLNVAYQYQNAYCELIKVIDDNRKRIEDFFQKFPHHPLLSLKVFFEHYDNYEKELRKYIKVLQEKDCKYFDNDTIFDTLAELYDGKVGEDYSEDQYLKIYKEGDNRYKSKIPPGYKDDTKEKKEKGDRHLYGDYIVWRQIIDKATKEKRDIIFVSDDLKEDWILEIHGKKKGPRKELIKEFYDETEGNTILIYNQEQFLNYARTNEKADIKEETIKEVKTVHQDMQQFYSDYQLSSILDNYSNIGAMYSSAYQDLTKPSYYNDNIKYALDSCKSFGDGLKFHTDNIIGGLEPFSRLHISSHEPNYITSINDMLYSGGNIHNQLLGKQPSSWKELVYPSFKGVGIDDKK